MEKNKKRNIIFYISLAGCFLTLLAILLIYFSMCKNQSDYNDLRSNVKSSSSQFGKLDEEGGISIDFDSLKKKNNDIYAWITIPNTNVDYPIVQSYVEDDDFYLNHNVDKVYDINGAIYTEKHNKTDFSDPVTVIYGHNMLDGSMFQNLHNFRNEKFFKKNKYIYVYLPDKILTYTIVSAYKSDDRHILNSYDFEDPQVFFDYLETIKDPKSMLVNKREIQLDNDDKIITLSTCIGNEDNYRYLVQGVLTDEKPIK